jgi:hypothetical protein
LDSGNIKEVIKETSLPSPLEQPDIFLLYLGDQTKYSVGESSHILPNNIFSIIGGTKENDALYIIMQLKEGGLINASEYGDYEIKASMTFEGWRQYEELKRSVVDSRIAFMAMPFHNELLDSVYKNCFQKAVDLTGFKLERIDENPKAGSINDRMRVEIRRSKFLIAELTNNNSGAYWEAGFSEGLGKPVFLQLREAIF